MNIKCVNKNITPFVLFQRIAKNLGCKFSYKGKFIPYSKVFEFGGFLPKIIENANLLSKATVGYGVGSEYSDDKKTVYLSPKFPLGYLALFVADIIEQLIDRTNFAKLFLVDVEVLELSKLNLVVMLDELYGQSEDSNEILFKYKFVGDAYLSKDFSELYKLDLQELKESLAKLNILCNCAGNDTANKSADNFIKDIKKAVSYYTLDFFNYSWLPVFYIIF